MEGTLQELFDEFISENMGDSSSKDERSPMEKIHYYINNRIGFIMETRLGNRGEYRIEYPPYDHIGIDNMIKNKDINYLDGYLV